jgi:hypothetical protein
MSSQTPELENCTVVLLGSFNPAIFHPEWFIRMGLLPVGARDPSGIKVVSPDVSECVLGPVKVFCDNTRLIFSVGNMTDSDKLQDLVIGSLSILGHVPLTAAGINQEGVFKTRSEAHWHKIGHTLVPKELVWNKLGDTPGTHQILVKYPLDKNSGTEQHISVTPYPQGTQLHPAIKINTNIHYQIGSATEVPTSGGTTSIAAAFIREQWKYATTRVRAVADVVFEQIKP